MKSWLMDTIVRGLPMPAIIVRESLETNSVELIREVVDGQQRLRTLFTYVRPQVLEDYREDADHFTVRKIHNQEVGG